MSPGALAVRDVWHKYPARGRGASALPVLCGIDLSIPAGEIWSVVGPSGCGKTTLLQVVGSFLAPRRGWVEVDGAVVRRPGPDRVLLSQADSLFGWQTALGNVAFGLKARGLGRAEREARAREWLAAVEMEAFAAYWPHQLSGGMKQRVTLARAWAVAPAIVLMDEPFAALDLWSRMGVHDLLLRLWESLRHTVVLATHALDEAVYLSDRVVVLSPRPARVVRVVDVPLPRPRHPAMRASAAFAEVQAGLHAEFEAARAAVHAPAATALPPRPPNAEP